MIRLIFGALGRARLADGTIQRRLTGMAQRLEQQGNAGEAAALKRHTTQDGLDTAAEAQEAAWDLRTLKADSTALSRAGISPQEVEETIQQLQQLRARLLAHGKAPEQKVKQAAALFTAYAAQSQVALDAIYHQGYADFVDTFGGTDRVRPSDAADATLRLNASVYSVMRDVRNGTLRPQAFGKASWEQVDGRAMYDLAMKRLDADSIDYDKAIPEMQRDALWRGQPIMIHEPGEKAVELKPGNFSGFWKRSVYSAAAPNEAAESFEALAFARKVRDGAVAAANGTGSEAAATVDTAYAFYTGQGYAKNASQATAALVAAAKVDLVKEIKAAPAGATTAQLEARQKNGEIDGFFPAPGGGFITYKAKSLQEVARDVKGMLDRGELNHLPAGTRQKIAEMIGPPGNPGATLKARLDDEDSGRFWRQFSSEVITLAAVGIASGGVGLAAEGFALGLNASRFAITAARTVAASATFTTLMGASQGKLEWQRYPIDLAMFGALNAAGRFAKLAQKLVPGGKIPQAIVVHSATVATSATVLTGFTTLEGLVKGKEANWEEMKSQFGRNLLVVGVLHGIGQGLQRIGPAARGGKELEQKVIAAASRWEKALERMHEILAKLEPAKKAVEQAKASGVSKDEIKKLQQELDALLTERRQLFKQFEALKNEVRDIQQEFVDYARRALPADKAAQVTREYGTDPADVARVNQIRQTHQVPEGKNVAFAEVDIPGIPEKSMDAVSGMSPAGTVPMPVKNVLPVIKMGDNPRSTDTEYKILNDLAQRLKPDAKGYVRLFTERCACPSCAGAIAAFRKMFPGVKLVVNNGEMR